MPELMRTGKQVDHLPIIVTGIGVSQLLKVGRLPLSTGLEKSKAVVSTLDDRLTKRVVGMQLPPTVDAKQDLVCS